MIHFADAPATCILLAANILVFLAEERAGGSARPDIALRFGAQSLSLLRRGQYWRLAAAMFLHFGFLHLLFNMYALWNLGPPLESLLGPLRYLLLYLLSGLAGNLLTWYRETRTRETISAGASGAVFGLLGAYLALALLPSTRPYIDLQSLATVLILNLAYGFSSKSINMAAHLGGLLSGLLLSLLLL